MLACTGYAAQSSTTPLAPFRFDRRDPGPTDVQVDIEFCGVCHSDLHMARNEWGNSVYPMVPGHEIVGRVSKVGAQVRKVREGDRAGVGVIVDSCRQCPNCRDGLEIYCDVGATPTYGGPDKKSPGWFTQGGYSRFIVTDEHFVHRMPEGLDPAAAAPLLCAGITTYSPLRHWGCGPGKKVGIVGLGGLGHMGLKFAHALGAHTVLLTTSPGKADEARAMGADEVVVSRDPAQMAKHANSFDLLLDTVSASHDMNALLVLLKRDATLIQVGLPEQPLSVIPFALALKRRSLAGSAIGGMAETQQMLEFCAEHGIVAEIELVGIADIETAFARMLKQDVRYRFVIDMKSLGEA
jgi:uncharacterized zinc-type alcohol dehydrogenase-like protein